MSYLILGLTLGLAAGVSPGPLQTLVVTTTLQRGFAGGWRVAVAPLLTDAPIVALSVIVLSRLPDAWLSALAIGGGVVLVGLGIKEVVASFRPVPIDTTAGQWDVWRGVAVNALSPHPWVFWATIGGPTLVSAWREQPTYGVGFVVGFFGLLVGAKLVLAAFVAVARDRLSEPIRRALLFGGGLLLAAVGVVLIVGEL